MPRQINNIAEYNVDYREKSQVTIKSTPITTATLKNKPINNTTLKKRSIKQTKFNDNKDSRSTTNVSGKKTEKVPIRDPQIGCIKTSSKTKKQMGFYRILFACVTMVLSITGIAILLSAMNRTTCVISNSPTFTKYNNYIAPVVMHNPDPFNESEKANINMVISSSIWRTILQNGTDHYKEFDEQGLTLIPINDIQTACTDLFGPTYNINTNENIYGPFYSYTIGEKNFHISAISNLGTYVPHIEEIIEEGDDLNLNVSYLSRDDKYLSTDESKSDTPTPVKSMKYKLKINKDTNKYYIYAIENL